MRATALGRSMSKAVPSALASAASVRVRAVCTAARRSASSGSANRTAVPSRAESARDSRASASAWGRFLPVSDSPRRLTMPDIPGFSVSAAAGFCTSARWSAESPSIVASSAMPARTRRPSSSSADA